MEKRFTYRGNPVYRHGNIIYYGSINETHIIMMQIMETDAKGDPSRIIVQLFLNDESISPTERFVKKAEKKGMYDAMDLASVWLDHYKSI